MDEHRPGGVGSGNLGSTALLTDHYELTMIDAALAAGTAHRRCVFEVFNRRLPSSRRYAVSAGVGRLVDAIGAFSFDEEQLRHLEVRGVVSPRMLDWLADYSFRGDVDGYAEGELFFPNSPILSVETDFASGVIIETLVLSILNHDSAIASAASRMVTAAEGRPLIEMGGRRTHEDAAVAAARAAFIAGFDFTSNLEAGHRHGLPTAGTAAHAFTLLHDSEADAFRAQVASLGVGTTLLVDTYDVTAGINHALEAAGTQLGAIRLDSGDPASMALAAREQLDRAGADKTRIVVTSDLDEYAIQGLSGSPVDVYGVGTALVTGSGVPTVGLVYKLVEVDGRGVAKKSAGEKSSVGGRKRAVRQIGSDGRAVAELVGGGVRPRAGTSDRALTIPLMRAGEPVADASLQEARERHRSGVQELPDRGRALDPGDPAIPTIRS